MLNFIAAEHAVFYEKISTIFMIIAKNVWRVHSSNSPWKYVLKHRLFCLFKTNEKDKQINTINT